MERLLFLSLTLLCAPGIASAQYAAPPDEALAASPPESTAAYYYPSDTRLDGEVAVSPPPESTLRITTGPAIRLWDRAPAGGLAAALELGRRAAGARFTGVWVGAGSEMGLAQYTGELWLDFGYGHALHPLLGAGGGVALLDVANESGNLSRSAVGMGSLRAGLAYSLPIPKTDARAGMDVVGCVPAIHGASSPTIVPWLLAVGTVTVGF